MRDFTLYKYRELLQEIIKAKYSFVTDMDAFKSGNKVILMRHDVDMWPKTALSMAKIEHEFQVKSIYYFRAKKVSYDPKKILEIKKLGHSLGYHYEDLCDTGGNVKKAYDRFQINLKKFRKLTDVKTIAMHGRPLSKWDSKDIWTEYNYKDLGIDFEPYLDIDFNNTAYYTDTAGMWDGEKYSIRDFVNSSDFVKIHTTDEMIGLFAQNRMPDKIHLNIHPAKWNNNILVWAFKKYVLTDSKLLIKSQLKKVRKRKNERI